MIAGTRGGYSRAKIITALIDRPSNINQLADILHMDYKTVKHHIEVLQKNKLIVSQGDKYGVVYFPSSSLEANINEFNNIYEKMNKDGD